MRKLLREIIVDNFAGGGGASTGIELAIGRSVDVAINHDPAAIAMHKTNHPDTKHYCESVWDVDPREAAGGQPVALAWFSPDCKHFSKAKGGKPVEKKIRGLAWVAVRWAATVRPRVIMLENVEEFQTWGPIKDGQPDQKQKGRTFRSFVNALRRLGYEVDWRELRACDYGAPTIRKRFFLVARRDGQPIKWPQPTHGEPNSIQVKKKLLKPWKPVGDEIDWSLNCVSIFERKKPLAEKTQLRIHRGLQRFVLENPHPYIAPIEAKRNNNVDLVTAFLAQYHSETTSREARGQTLDKPIMTLDTSNRYALVTSYLVKMKGSNIGQPMTEPIHTITAGGLHFAEVRAFLVKYYGAGIGQEVSEPIHTIPTKDRFGLVTVYGEDHMIVDIGFRMLEPHELFPSQGFPREYIINRDYTGKPYPKTEQVARCGNSVPPPFAQALVRANLPELCVELPYQAEHQLAMQFV